MRIRYIIPGFVWFCLVSETIHASKPIKCFHCGWSQQQNYQRLEKEDADKLPYPAVTEEYVLTQADLHRPPTAEQLKNYCKWENCPPNSACLIWSFMSKNPINITYMCVGNPRGRKGCYQQEVPNKDVKEFLKVEACLCDTGDFCNRSSLSPTSFGILALSLTILIIFGL